MDRTFNFRQSQELLQVDPKTFGRWLEKAQIDPEKQVNRADPRQKWLTEEQLRMLAKEHGRELPPLDQEDEPEPRPALILTTVDERLFALEQLLTHRFDQLNARLEQLLTELQRARASTPPQEHPPKPTVKKRGKRKTKARNLPRTLTPLFTFRQVHSISEKAVENAAQRNKLAVVRGAWLYNHRHITTALDQQGQQQFYALFSQREGFQPCKDCPHAL